MFLSLIKRFGFFLALNFVLMMMFSGIMYFLPINPGYYGSMLILYSLFGFGGALISLFLSKYMAKWTMGVKVIDPRQPGNQTEKWLLEAVHNYARLAGLKKMPEVGIYPGQELNAFATGPSKSNSLVAVSEGLLRGMNQEEVEGVLGHEVAHIKNGDMVTMVLLQGTINTLVMFASRILANIVASNLSKNRRNFWLEFILYQVFAMVLGMLGLIVLGFFSRGREYRADQGGARLAGQNKMIKALQRLQGAYGNPAAVQAAQKQTAFSSLKISGKSGSSLAKLLSTHPPLEERIRRLQGGRSLRR